MQEKSNNGVEASVFQLSYDIKGITEKDFVVEIRGHLDSVADAFSNAYQILLNEFEDL